MKVYEYMHPAWGRVFNRISGAFHRFAPSWVEWVNTPEESDIYIVNVVGAGERKQLDYPHPNKVIIQYCYYTAQIEQLNYVPYWKDALLTVSFHDLTAYTNEKFNFFRAPLGADPEVFKRYNPNSYRRNKVFVTGHVANDECIDKVYEAVKQLDEYMVHTGENFKWGFQNYRYLDYLSDNDYVALLNNTQYISCLRRIEGFELAGVEGLFCGARPIIPDIPTYDAYRKYAYTVSLDDTLVEQLVGIMQDEPKVITFEEYNEIVRKFSWNTIIRSIFSEIERQGGWNG
ncbi:MAG: hypothetical protein WC554_19350 [Clostridia bacterium]